MIIFARLIQRFVSMYNSLNFGRVQ